MMGFHQKNREEARFRTALPPPLCAARATAVPQKTNSNCF
jgi:hypothetical protein